jgi:CheY-like chemotaxis protein
MLKFVAAGTIERGQFVETSRKASGVIVADDESLIRNILRAKLEAIDQDVFLAYNGLEAVTLASRMQATMVMLDVRMPKLDGFHACARIRQLPGYESTPIVMLTADNSPRAHAAATRAGATMFLVKPFGSAALMLALSKYVPIDEATILEMRSTVVRAAGWAPLR